MMSLSDQLTEDMKTAMKAKDKLRLETIRSLRGLIKNAQIEKGQELTDEEMLQELSSAAKKRKESADQYAEYGRAEQAEQELAELSIIQSYLPAQMNAEEIAALVMATVEEVGAASMKEMGKVMGAIMPKVKGKADGKLVQQIVKEKLSDL